MEKGVIVNKRKDVRLSYNNQEFTLDDWWNEFSELILSEIEPSSISYYASTYKATLNKETKNEWGWQFDHALWEQIAESFVAYMLNIQTNPEGWTDFKSESFGNVEQLRKYQSGESRAANQKWLLIDKLCQSTVIS
jgi:hypothetical protein